MRRSIYLISLIFFGLGSACSTNTSLFQSSDEESSLDLSGAQCSAEAGSEQRQQSDKIFDSYWSSGHIQVPEASKDELKSIMRETLTSVPVGLQLFYYNMGGQIIVSEDPKTECGKGVSEIQHINMSEGEGDDRCLQMPLADTNSEDQLSMPNIILNGNADSLRKKYGTDASHTELMKHEIATTLLAGFSRVLAQTITMLVPDAPMTQSGDQFVFDMSVAEDTLASQKREVFFYYLAELAKQKRDGTLEKSRLIDGILAHPVLGQKTITNENFQNPNNGKNAYEKQQFGYGWQAAYDAVRSLQNDESAKLLSNVAFANSFHDLNCNQATKAKFAKQHHYVNWYWNTSKRPATNATIADELNNAFAQWDVNKLAEEEAAAVSQMNAEEETSGFSLLGNCANGQCYNNGYQAQYQYQSYGQPAAAQTTANSCMQGNRTCKTFARGLFAKKQACGFKQVKYDRNTKSFVAYSNNSCQRKLGPIGATVRGVHNGITVPIVTAGANTVKAVHNGVTVPVLNTAGKVAHGTAKVAVGAVTLPFKAIGAIFGGKKRRR